MYTPNKHSIFRESDIKIYQQNYVVSDFQVVDQAYCLCIYRLECYISFCNVNIIFWFRQWNHFVYKHLITIIKNFYTMIFEIGLFVDFYFTVVIKYFLSLDFIFMVFSYTSLHLIWKIEKNRNVFMYNKNIKTNKFGIMFKSSLTWLNHNILPYKTLGWK